MEMVLTHCFAQFEGQIFAYEGDGEGGFASTDLGIGNTGGEPKSVLWADFDNDGDQDLFITQRLSVNRLYARMPDGSLTEVPGAGGMAGTDLERTYGAAVADFNKDGRLDVYLCHYHTPQTNSEETGFFEPWEGLDLSMTFQDVTSQAGVGNGVKQSFQATWVDLDRDGFLICTSSTTGRFGQMLCIATRATGLFVDMSNSWGIDIGQYSMSSTIADFDKDQDWDFVVTNGAAEGNHPLSCSGTPFQDASQNPPMLWYNNVAEDAGILLEDLPGEPCFSTPTTTGGLICSSEQGHHCTPIILQFSLFIQTPTTASFSMTEDLPLEAAFVNVLTDNELTFSSAY